LASPITFARRHWFTLGLLAATVIGVNWVVTHKRAPGSMTLIEAQSMDMMEIKAPSGVMPVQVESVLARSLRSEDEFPATVLALSDEEVVARVPGQLGSDLAYPGQRVVAGELLGTIGAKEFELQEAQAAALAAAKGAEVLSADRMIDHHRNILASAKASSASAIASKSKAVAELEATRLELEKDKSELLGAKAMVADKAAVATFSKQELAREKDLFKQGAVALEEVQASQRDFDSATAQVNSARSGVLSAEQSVKIAERRVVAAQAMIGQANAEIAVADAGEAQAREGIAQAHADSSAKRFESKAANADTGSAETMSSYRQLKATSPGTVSARLVSPGTAVTVGQPILRITRADKVRVQADVPQGMSAKVHVGEKAVVRIDGISKGCRITSVFPVVDVATRTFRIEAVVSNLSGELKAGMYGRLELDGDTKSSLAVKTAAILSDEVGKFVWTVVNRTGTDDSDWTCTMHPQISRKGSGKCPICNMDLVLREKGGKLMAHRVPITTGRVGASYTEVISGLHQGDQVIWSGEEGLIEGTPVSIQSARDGTEVPERKDPSASPMDSMPGMVMPSDSAAKPPQTTNAGSRVRSTRIEYVCPMDKEVVASKPGKCPKCGMDLVKREVGQ